MSEAKPCPVCGTVCWWEEKGTPEWMYQVAHVEELLAKCRMMSDREDQLVAERNYYRKEMLRLEREND